MSVGCFTAYRHLGPLSAKVSLDVFILDEYMFKLVQSPGPLTLQGFGYASAF